MATWLLTKKNHDEHFFRFIRDDATETSTVLETRSMLRHDFAHYAVESIAGLKQSFFGMLNAGIDIDRFMDKKLPPPISHEALTTEMVSALLQSATSKDTTVSVLEERVVKGLETMGLQTPHYVTFENIKKMQLEFRLLFERWQVMKTGETMTLDW